jgi:hypothetical protein
MATSKKPSQPSSTAAPNAQLAWLKAAATGGLKGEGRENCWIFCHCWSLITKRLTWGIMLAAFLVLWVVEFVIHGLILMPHYQATASLWLAPESMKLGFIYGSYALQATVFAVLIQLATRTVGSVEGARTGLIIYSLPTVSLMVVAGTQPVPCGILMGWALSYLVSGMLMGLAAQLVRQWAACRAQQSAKRRT